MSNDLIMSSHLNLPEQKNTNFLPQAKRYVAVGVLNTLVTFSIFIIAPWLFGFNYLTSYSLGIVTGFLTSFVLNSKYTFRGSNISHVTSLKYISVFVISYATSYNVVVFIANTQNSSPTLAQLSGMAIYTCLSFVLFRTLVFGGAKI